MSDIGTSGNGREEVSEFSLVGAVEEIRRHGIAQMENLREKQKTLSSLQATLEEAEKKGQVVDRELRSRIREILVEEAGIEGLEEQRRALEDRCASLSEENAGLQARVAEEEEAARALRAQVADYRKKMDAHRAAASQSESQTEARKVLEEKRESVRKLKEEKEELRGDLEDPNGRTVEKAKRELDALKAEISVMKATAAETRERLRKETETQAAVREDTEIQKRRYEAVVRRLQLQLSRARTARRQVCDDIGRMERELGELKRRL